MTLYDSAEKPRAMLIVTAERTGLGLSDAAGKVRAALSEGSLGLWGANPNVSAMVSADNFGPHLRLDDAQQFKAVVGVTALQTTTTGERTTTSVAAVTLFGKDGKVIWRAP